MSVSYTVKKKSFCIHISVWTALTFSWECFVFSPRHWCYSNVVCAPHSLIHFRHFRLRQPVLLLLLLLFFFLVCRRIDIKVLGNCFSLPIFHYIRALKTTLLHYFTWWFSGPRIWVKKKTFENVYAQQRLSLSIDFFLLRSLFVSRSY